MNRRTFITHTAGLIAAAPFAPALLTNSTAAPSIRIVSWYYRHYPKLPYQEVLYDFVVEPLDEKFLSDVWWRGDRKYQLITEHLERFEVSARPYMVQYDMPLKYPEYNRAVIHAQAYFGFGGGLESQDLYKIHSYKQIDLTAK